MIDTATDAVTATVSVGSYPLGVAVSPNGSRAYVANDGSGTVSVIDTATDAVTATVAVGANPDGVAVSPDGSRVYVTNQCASYVSVIGAATNSVVASVNVGANPTGVAVSPDGGQVYVANGGSGTVSVIDTATNSVVANVNVGISPAGVAVSPDGSRVYVVNGGSGTVSVIDPATDATVASPIAVGVYPVSLGEFVGPGALVATNSSASGNAGTQISSTVPTLVNGTNCSASDATVQSPARGSLTFNATTGAFTYTPTSSTYSGPDAFTWRGQATSCPAANAPLKPVSNTATVSLTLNPLLTGLSDIFVDEGTSTQKAFSLTGSTPFTHTLASDNATVLPPAGVTVSPAACGTAGNLACTLAVTAAVVPGTASVTFQAKDKYNNPVTKTLLITVLSSPVALNASYNVKANHAVGGQLKATASASQTLTYSIVSRPADGVVRLKAATGQFGYIPNRDYTGPDTFTFNVSDGTLTSNTATVTLKVAAGSLAVRGGAGGGAFGPWGLAILAGLTLLIAMARKKGSTRRPRGGKAAMFVLGLVLIGSALFTAIPARAAGAWYVGLQANVIKPAGGRNSATAGFNGWTFLFGRHLGKHFAVEFDRAYYSDNPRTLTATANWVNWGLRGLYFPWKSQGAFAPFVLAGLGHQYEYRGDGSEPSNNSASLGLGFTSQPWSGPVAIRAELEAQHGFGGGYTDRVFTLGVTIPLDGG